MLPQLFFFDGHGGRASPPEYIDRLFASQNASTSVTFSEVEV